MEALNVQNVRKVFNSPSTGEHIALQGIDLTIQKGELFFLLGDRKSTRLNSSHLAVSRMPSSA